MLWQVHPQNIDRGNELAGLLNISSITAGVLMNRGLLDPQKAREFLYPTLTHLHDPFLMSGMEAAVTRVIRAIKDKEKILIYGDYDADGATSTALLVKFFKTLGVDVHYYIPHRINEGYGMHRSAIDPIKRLATDLIITVDNGISAEKEVEYANSLGMDVIVTDHHEPPERLPAAVAIINPKQKGCRFPFKNLAGVGVAFNLVIALRQRLREEGFFANTEEPRLKEYLDLVAIGTVADVVPLVDENRVFVKFGLEEIKRSSNKGISALKIVSACEQPHQINATSIAFRIAPRINAVGRVSDQHTGVRLLTTSDPEEAMSLAKELNDLNAKRQAIEAAILKEADQMIAELDKKMPAIVLYKEDWHIGVLGIVAARISEAHRKPAIVIAKSGAVCRGSARGVGDYDIVSAIAKAGKLVVSFGGHKHAAGLNIEENNIPAFIGEFLNIVEGTIKAEDIAEKMMIDAEVESGDITEELIKELELMEPFGEGNREPVFCLKELKVAAARVVADKHLKLKFTDNVVVLEGIGFGMGGRVVTASDILDVAFIPQRDTWKGNGAVQLKLCDLK